MPKAKVLKFKGKKIIFDKVKKIQKVKIDPKNGTIDVQLSSGDLVRVLRELIPADEIEVLRRSLDAD